MPYIGLQVYSTKLHMPTSTLIHNRKNYGPLQIENTEVKPFRILAAAHGVNRLLSHRKSLPTLSLHASPTLPMNTGKN